MFATSQSILYITRNILIKTAIGLPLLCLPLVQAHADSGRPIYQKYCTTCHGKTGNSQTNAGQSMTPPPTDFTAPSALVTLTKERMIQSIQEGRKGTAMVAWKTVLSADEIAAVAEYIRDSLMLSSRDKEASPGRQLFANNCSVCHGDKGDVAVWARSGLAPPPRNFTNEQARQELTRERMIFSVNYGRQETAMPAWVGRLKPEEISLVVDYIRQAFLFPGGTEPKQPQPAAHSNQSEHDHSQHYEQANMTAAMPKGLIGDTVWGKKFYNRNCADCHGELGDGKGKRSDFIYPRPRNFLHPASQHKFNRPHLFEVIGQGTRGTEMPAWSKVLTDAEIAHLAEYVFITFIQPNAETNPPASSPATHTGEHDHAAPPATQSKEHDHAAPPATQPKEHDHTAPPATQPKEHDHAAPPATQTGAHDLHTTEPVR